MPPEQFAQVIPVPSMQTTPEPSTLVPFSLDLILASTSQYRRELLQRLTPHFRQIAPQVDETALPDESASDLAQRLARAKALAIARIEPHAFVIGSDQVAAVDAHILGKPHTHERACEQLAACSGRSVLFHTAICLVDPRNGVSQVSEDCTRVVFRDLRDEEIETYLRLTTPYDCAGSFKAEGLGIALFERIENNDPTALIGLPLIALARMLRAAGVSMF